MTGVLALVTTLATSTATPTPALIESLIAGRGELPALVEVQRAAEEALHLASAEDVEGWARRARLRGLVPRVEAGLGSDADRAVRAGTGGTALPSTTEGQQLGLDLGVRFELGELVFSDLELRANREAIARAAAVQVVRDRATELYFDRLEVALRQRESSSAALTLAAARLDGLLEALTGGRLRWPRKKETR